jgi:hypothetical protein
MNLCGSLNLSIFTFLLVGCASTSGSLCPIPTHAPSAVSITETDKKIESLTRSNFYDPNPTREVSGIKTFNLVGSHLSISLFNKAFYEEYSAPNINVVREKKYEPHPFYGISGTILSGGLIWISDSEYHNFVFGCTDETSMGSYPDTSKQTKTGKSEWRDLKKSHKLLVEGFGKSYTFWQEDIDLSSIILNSDIDKSTNIEITCLDCELGNQDEQSIFKDLKKSVHISADFREIKSLLVAQDKANKINQVKRDKEAEIERINQEKENLKLRKESLGVPLEGFKEQCKQIGFKEKSPDFGDCVLQLNNSK